MEEGSPSEVQHYCEEGNCKADCGDDDGRTVQPQSAVDMLLSYQQKQEPRW